MCIFQYGLQFMHELYEVMERGISGINLPSECGSHKSRRLGVLDCTVLVNFALSLKFLFCTTQRLGILSITFIFQHKPR